MYENAAHGYGRCEVRARRRRLVWGGYKGLAWVACRVVTVRSVLLTGVMVFAGLVFWMREVGA